MESANLDLEENKEIASKFVDLPLYFQTSVIT